MPGRTRAALVALGLLFGFALWTAFSLGWAESSERTANELARVAAYLGVFALGVCLVTRRRAGAKHVLDGVTFGLALVCALAVLSRLHMAWFPPNELGKVLPGIEIERRLAYPLNYSDQARDAAKRTARCRLAPAPRGPGSRAAGKAPRGRGHHPQGRRRVEHLVHPRSHRSRAGQDRTGAARLRQGPPRKSAVRAAETVTRTGRSSGCNLSVTSDRQADNWGLSVWTVWVTIFQ